jgi:uncharacterized oligopeptide transporter (OPT) family protein
MKNCTASAVSDTNTLEGFDEDKEKTGRSKDEKGPSADSPDSDEEVYTSIVPTTDDPSLKALTPRVFLIGTFFALLLSFVNTVLSFRTSGFQVNSTLAILLSYPLARVLPFSSPFNIKEHVLIGVIASAASGTPYGLDNVIVQKFHLFIGNDNITYWESLAWCLITQFLGFGIGTYRFLF